MEAYKEFKINEQKQDNLKKAMSLVNSFPKHETIRLLPIVGSRMEIEVNLFGLGKDEKIMKIYESLNNYI